MRKLIKMSEIIKSYSKRVLISSYVQVEDVYVVFERNSVSVEYPGDRTKTLFANLHRDFSSSPQLRDTRKESKSKRVFDRRFCFDTSTLRLNLNSLKPAYHCRQTMRNILKL